MKNPIRTLFGWFLRSFWAYLPSGSSSTASPVSEPERPAPPPIDPPMHIIDRKRFFDVVRRRFGRLHQSQVDGFNAILEAWEKHYPDGLPQQLAYIMATAWHESGRTMQPVRESGLPRGETPEERREYDEKACHRVYNYLVGRGRSTTDPTDNYAIRLPNGHAYYGRGLPQLTWPKNYIRMGEKLGLPLYENPDLMCELDVSAEVLVVGSMDGDFTGVDIPRYVNDKRADYQNARRVINGTDRAYLIAQLARGFEAALR